MLIGQKGRWGSSVGLKVIDPKSEINSSLFAKTHHSRSHPCEFFVESKAWPMKNALDVSMQNLSHVWVLTFGGKFERYGISCPIFLKKSTNNLHSSPRSPWTQPYSLGSNWAHKPYISSIGDLGDEKNHDWKTLEEFSSMLGKHENKINIVI